MVSAPEIISELEKRGVRFAVVGRSLRAAPASAIPPDLDATVGKLKNEIIVELRRRSPAEVAEWQVEGCARFTVLANASETIEALYGACLSCGASWELHGCPDRAAWRRVADLDDVQLVAIRFVLAAARKIALSSKL